MIAILFAFTTSAQNPIFEKGNIAINAGLGVDFIGLPFEVSCIYGIVDDLFRVDGLNLGVGGYLGFSTFSIYGFSVHPGVRGEVHYSIVDKLDFFGGALIEYNYLKNRPRYGLFGLYTGLYVGAKYFITDNFGFYASTGYGMTYVSAGIALQF